MASSYGKRTWFHELVGIISLLSMVACFLMLDHKPCQIPLLPRDELKRWSIKPMITGTEILTKTLREKNQTNIAEEIELFIENYYDHLQIFHISIGCWSIIIMLFGLINIVPKHEDFKVMTILFMVLIMGFAALFAFYTAFLAFHKPCRALTTSKQNDYHPNNEIYYNNNDDDDDDKQQNNDDNHDHNEQNDQEEEFQITRANLRYLRYYFNQLQHQQPPKYNQSNYNINEINNNNNNNYNNGLKKMITFKKPTKIAALTTLLSFWNNFNHQNNNNNNNNNNINNDNRNNYLQLKNQLIFMLEFRSIKDKRPVNVFEDEDDIMIRITLINSAVGFILLCSDFLFFFDSRQHMIEWRN